MTQASASQTFEHVPPSATITHLGPDSFVGEDRRSAAEYRDLGLEAATGGQFAAVVARPKLDFTRPPGEERLHIGWHRHVNALQFLYVLEGWMEIEFSDGTVVRAEKGSSVHIPNGLVHRETNASADCHTLEVRSPADMATVDMPQGARLSGPPRSD